MKSFRYDAPTMRTPALSKKAQVAKVAQVVSLFCVASCAGLQCDADKRESIEHLNAGVDKVKSQSTNDAIKEFELALRLDPENHLAAYNLGAVYAQSAEAKCRQATASAECQQLWDKAMSALEQAVKNNSDDAMYVYKLGNAQFESGKLDQARVSLEKAISINKKLFKAHFILGRVHAAQARPKEAALEWTESARLNPGFGKPFINLGKLYYTWDHFAESTKVLEQGAQTARDAEDRAAINYQLGLSYDALQQWDKAIAAYQKSLEDDAGNLDAKMQLGFTYAEKGDKANAKKFLEEYTKSAGSNEANAFKLMAANTRLMKLMAADTP